MVQLEPRNSEIQPGEREPEKRLRQIVKSLSLSRAVTDCAEIWYTGWCIMDSPRRHGMIKIHFCQIQDGGLHPNCKWLNRNNSATDCSIFMKFGKLVHYWVSLLGLGTTNGTVNSSGNAALIASFFSSCIYYCY